MKKTRRGFKIGRRFSALFGWLSTRNPRRTGYRPLLSSAEHDIHVDETTATTAKFLRWARKLWRTSSGRRVGPPPREAEAAVPKGYMAVYVGWKGAEDHGDRPSRFLVPVMYFNDPLFGGLLREAEEEFGYDHPGGITIPCRISEFESVRGRIAAARGFSRRLLRRI
ncbi:hypothetical protein QJS10_CPB11g00414 [Acorus calamus]|uniref:Uncharacterized protein n=1 Tax=Acorus calamus TaxID=4465 RepID=A0AAV9DXB2_ACOCL|nr:hypothetical protein QJS10_CPB11g00414 [Acorus calamus]